MLTAVISRFLKSRSYKKTQAAFSLVELLLAIGLFIIVIGANFMLAVDALRARQNGQTKVQAGLLINDSLNGIYSIKSSYWYKILANKDDGDKHIVFASDQYEIVSGDTLIGDITLNVRLDDVERDGGGNIVDSGGTVDVDTVKATLTTSWVDMLGQSQSVVEEAFINNWDRTIWLQSTVAEFTNGSADDISITGTGDGEIQLTGQPATGGDWCDPATYLYDQDIFLNTAYSTSGGNFALDFDGSEDFASIETFDVSPSKSSVDGLTIEGWVKIDDFDYADARIISKATNTTESGTYWELGTTGFASNYNPRFRVKADGVTTTLTASDVKLKTGVWYHIAGTFDGSEMVIFVNGVQMDSVSKSGTLDTNSSLIFLGKHSAGGNTYFDGQLDEVRVWDYARSGSEINNNFLQSIDPTTSGIQLYLNSNEGEGIQTDDTSDNAYTVTMGSLASADSGDPAWADGNEVLGSFENSIGLNFNGTEDYLNLGNYDVSPGGGGNDGITIEAWVKADDFDNAEGRILSKATGTAEADHYWMISTYNKPLGGYGFRYRLKTDTGGTTTLSNEGEIQVGLWTHVAATYDGAEMVFYQNGIEVGRTSKTGLLTTGAVAINAGRNPDGSNFFDGSIDELRIWDHARTEQEINNNLYMQIDATSSGLVGYYQMNENTGQRVVDLTGQSGDATLGATTSVESTDPVWGTGFAYNPNLFDGTITSGSGNSTFDIVAGADGGTSKTEIVIEPTQGPSFPPTAPSAPTSYAVETPLTPDPGNTNTDYCDGTGIPVIECESLIRLYETTAGASWFSNTNWLQTNNPCNWYGITCSGGKVYNITLNGNNLNGSIPTEIGNFTNINNINLSSNSLLSGDIPEEIGNLSTLKNLYLQQTIVTNIPDDIGNLTSMLTMYVYSANVSDTIPNTFGNLVNLTSLYLYDNSITGTIPKSLGGATSLSTLTINQNSLVGGIPPELGNLASLSVFDVSENTLSCHIPPEIGNTSLVLIDISDTSIYYPSVNTDLNAYLIGKITASGMSDPAVHSDCYLGTEDSSGNNAYLGYGHDDTSPANSILSESETTYSTPGPVVDVTADALESSSWDEGGAIDLDGSDDKVTIPAASILDPGLLSYTLEAWIKPDELPSDDVSIFSKAGSDEVSFLLNSSLQPKYILKDSPSGAENEFIDNAATSFEVGQWNHIAWVVDRIADEVYIYKNGTNISTTSISGIDDGIDPSGDIIIGEYSDNLNGQIDNVRVWNIARTATEISENYKSQIDPWTERLVGYYRFDDTSGQDIFDATTFESDGFLGTDNSVESTDPTLVTGVVEHIIMDMVIEGDYIYVVTSNPQKDLAIYDRTADPYVEVGYFDITSNNGSSARSIAVDSDEGYILRDNNLYVIDLSSKTGSRPQLGSLVDVNPKLTKIKILSNYAYIASYDSTIQAVIVDISDYLSMSVVGTVRI